MELGVRMYFDTFLFTRTTAMPNHHLQTRFGSVVFFLCCRQSINLAGKAVDSKLALFTADVPNIWI
jgi:hypothetical protein